MNRRIVLLGAGALGQNVLHIARSISGIEVVGFIDGGGGSEVYGVPVLGGDDALPGLRDRVDAAVVCIGNGRIRERVADHVRALGFETPSVVSPSAHVFVGAEVEEGCILFPNVYVGPGARVGRHAVLEASVVVGPGATVGAYSIVAPLNRIHAGAALPDHTKLD